MSLHIALLGPFTVTIDNTPVAFRTDAERALLAYLAAHQGTPQRRDTLATLLSPDRSDSDALTYLRNRLTRLRSAIADETATPPWLIIDRKAIALRAGDDIAIDITRFEQHLTTVENHAHRQLAGCPTCLARLDAAVALVRGELLAGLNFPSDIWETWLLRQREHLQQRSLHAMSLLRDARIEQGEWMAVLAIAHRQLTLEPWLEAAHRAVMQARARLNDRNAALSHYEQCAALLWEELGVEPEEATQALYRQLLDAGHIDGHLTDPILDDRVALPDNLPLATGHFFGRTTEKARLLERLADPHTRLMTIVGTGGVGKTRLALEVGRAIKANFPDGVWFVALDGIQGEPGRVSEQIQIAVGEAIGLGQMTGNDAAKQHSGEQVLAILRDKRLLLILDNCETVLDDLGFVPTWLSRAPGVVILATAREPLNFGAEIVAQLAGLSMGDCKAGDAVSGNPESGHPESGHPGSVNPESSEAEALFVAQAQMARADFVLSTENQPQVRRICQLVDGLPLGIALAAAWVRRRSLAQIIDSIQASLDFLSTRLRDVEPRHRSMRAVFETSWQMLEQEEQVMLAALAVFPATFTAEAAAQVAEAHLFALDLFCEKSLLHQQHEAERYAMHSLVRQFAAEKLGHREQGVTRAFVEYYVHFAHDHQDEYAALQPEWPNFSAAIGKAHLQERWQTVLDFVKVLYNSWYQKARLYEMRTGLVVALEAAQALGNDNAQAKTLLQLGEWAIAENDYEMADSYLADAIERYMRLEDPTGIAHSYYFLGRIKTEKAEDDEALDLLTKSKEIFEAEADWLGVARALNLMAYCHIKQDPASRTAADHLAQSLSLQQEMPPSQTYIEALLYLARLHCSTGQYTAAEHYLTQAANASREQNDNGSYIAVLFERMVLNRRLNQLDDAFRVGYECLELVQKIGLIRWEGLLKTQLAMVYQAGQNPTEAIILFQSSLHIFSQLGDLFEQAFAYYHLFRLYAEIGNSELSLGAKEKALQLNRGLKNAWLADGLK